MTLSIKNSSIMILRIISQSIMAFSVTTLSMTAISIMTLSIATLKLSVNYNDRNDTKRNSSYFYSQSIG
jgi:hypothetical protein